MVWNVGIDLVDFAEVRASHEAFGGRYVHRLFTQDEETDSAGDPERLARRFAGKEAAMKALQAADQLPWRSVAILGAETNHPTVRLTGPAADLAAAKHVRTVSISITSDRRRAAAIVAMELAG